MNLRIRVLGFDGTCKVASEDRVTNEGGLDYKNCCGRGIIHTLRLSHNYGKNHCDNPHI